MGLPEPVVAPPGRFIGFGVFGLALQGAHFVRRVWRCMNHRRNPQLEAESVSKPEPQILNSKPHRTPKP